MLKWKNVWERKFNQIMVGELLCEQNLWMVLFWIYLLPLTELLCLQSSGVLFCFNRICWRRQFMLLKNKNVTFNIQLLFWELPIYEREKNKVAPLTFMRNSLNIIINYTVNYLGLRLKGVCLSLKLMYFDSTPGDSSLWITGKMRASEERNHSRKWAQTRQGVNELPTWTRRNFRSIDHTRS